MGIFFNKEKRRDQSSGPKAKVLSFLNQKGGVGKTTMTFNTAHALARKGERVLCLDMDPQGNLGYLLGHTPVEGDYHILHLLLNTVRELKSFHSPVLPRELMKRSSGVDYIPSGQELSGFELSVAGISSPRQLVLKKFLEKSGLLYDYDYIIIDSPPTLGLLVVNILCSSEGVLVPFRPDEFSRKGLGHFYSVLEDIEDMGVSEVPDIVAHIPNLVDNRRKQENNDLSLIASEIEERFGKNTMVSAFLNRAPLVKAQSQKRSVFDYNGKEFTGLQEQFSEIAHMVNQWRDLGVNHVAN